MPRVFLFAGDHPIYRSLVEYPPSGRFEVFSGNHSESFDSLSIYSSGGYQLAKRIYFGISRILGIPRLFLPPRGYDLIHACRGFIPIANTPTVVDVEHVASFTNMDPVTLARSQWLLRRLLDRDSLRYILPHSHAAEQSIRSVFGTFFSDKIRVVYPAAMPAPCYAHPGSRDDFTILFVGKNFRIKGGFELYRAYKTIVKEYPRVRLIIKSKASEIPGRILTDPDVTVITKILPHDEVLRLYCSADVFVMPTYMDTFGYVYLEAMAAGLPIIGTDVFAVPEIIKDGYNGFTIHSEIRWHDDRYLHRGYFGFTPSAEQQVVNQLVEKLRILVEDPNLLRKMSKNALYLTTEGKFSIRHRNEQLREIYESAISG